MARKREFDDQKVLQAAAVVFAVSGYAGSSIDMLVAATGLQRGSIYKAFSSKAGLFRAALAVQVTQSEQPVHKEVLLDILIVAIWERAQIDPDVYSTVITALEYIDNQGKSISQTLYYRMAIRAQLPGALVQSDKEFIW